MTVPVKTQTLTQKKDESHELSLGIQGCDLELLFTNLKINSWKTIRILLQRRADIFLYNPDKTAAVAGFKLTTKNARKVLDLYLRLYRLKSVFVRIKGSTIDTLSEGNKWVHCWIMAHGYKDKTKWCEIPDEDPELYTGLAGWKDYLRKWVNIETRINIPCKAVQWRPDSNNPGTYKQQFEEFACGCGCDKCPLFNLERFKIRPIKPEESTGKEAHDTWDLYETDPNLWSEVQYEKYKKDKDL